MQTGARGAPLHPEAVANTRCGRPFPHTLLMGPPGTGKTTLAKRLADHLGSRFVSTSGPLLQDVHQLVRVLANVEEGDVLFVDEAHAVPQGVLEALYQAMDARSLSLPIQQGALARVIRFDLPRFVLAAATSEDADLPEAFRSRFGIRESLGYYDKKDLARILTRTAEKDGFTLEADACERLAETSRGTPREGLRLLARVLDRAAASGKRTVTVGVVAETLASLGYDAAGLSRIEHDYLECLRRIGEATALAKASAAIGRSPKTVLRDAEPYLFRQGLVRMTPRGRVAVVSPPGAIPVLSGRPDKTGMASGAGRAVNHAEAV